MTGYCYSQYTSTVKLEMDLHFLYEQFILDSFTWDFVNIFWIVDSKSNTEQIENPHKIKRATSISLTRNMRYK